MADRIQTNRDAEEGQHQISFRADYDMFSMDVTLPFQLHLLWTIIPVCACGLHKSENSLINSYDTLSNNSRYDLLIDQSSGVLMYQPQQWRLTMQSSFILAFSLNKTLESIPCGCWRWPWWSAKHHLFCLFGRHCNCSESSISPKYLSRIERAETRTTYNQCGEKLL